MSKKFEQQKEIAMVLARQYYREFKKDIVVASIINRPLNESQYAEDAWELFSLNAKEIWQTTQKQTKE